MTYRPSTAHLSLGPRFFDPVAPARFPQHVLRWRNQRWAERVGLDALSAEAFEAHFARFEPLPDNIPSPVALRYHGHQFQSYNPDIGDGRGFLFGQVHDDEGRLLDFGTKGSGRTPYSRSGDGRLTLKGGVREVLATALLEALGVYTSKSFALFETGEALMRGDEPSPTRSSVLTRLSHSHIRIGTFQRLLAENDADAIGRLVSHGTRFYHPHAARPNMAEEAPAFLRAVVGASAQMVSEWMLAGFVHGVLNTDNTVITGESFDYGPWRFLPHYEPGFTAAYFDATGLYCYLRQPGAIAWNLDRLAECLTLVAEVGALQEALDTYEPILNADMQGQVMRRLGLRPAERPKAAALLSTLFNFLLESKAPFERTFFDWRGGIARKAFAMAGPNAGFYRGEKFDAFLAALSVFDPMATTPEAEAYFDGAGPATLLIGEVEALWAPIAEHDDWSLFTAKLSQIERARVANGFVPARLAC